MARVRSSLPGRALSGGAGARSSLTRPGQSCGCAARARQWGPGTSYGRASLSEPILLATGRVPTSHVPAGTGPPWPAVPRPLLRGVARAVPGGCLPAEAGQTGLRQGSRRPLERTGGASSLRGPPSERAAFEPRPGLPAGGSQSTGPAPGCSQFPTRVGRRGAWLPPAGVPGNNRKQFWFHWSNKELGKACFLRAAARPSLSVPGREVGEQDPGAPGPFRANAPRVGLGTCCPRSGSL